MSRRAKWFLARGARFLIIGMLVLTAIFILPRAMPGDPVENLIGESAHGLSDEERQNLEEYFRLNDSLPDQYLRFLESTVTFDFGYSYTLGIKVTDLIEERLPWTILLTLPAILLGSLISYFLAIEAGTNRGGKTDKIFPFLSIYLRTVPGFLIAMVALRIFGVHLGIFPISHLSSGRYSGLMFWADVAYHLTLPIIIMTALIVSGKFLILRNSVTQISDSSFILAARSKGLDEDTIRERHIGRNIMPTFLSLLILNLGFMISGALLIQIVFSLNGMGTLLYTAIRMQDYPLIQGIFVILTTWVLLMNLLAEFAYGLVDPRVGDMIDEGVNG